MVAFPTFNFNPSQKDPLGTVYVVDDDSDVRDSMRRMLESQGFRVELFESGESFIAKYDPNAIAVLLLDERMPGGMSGSEVQEHLIARKATIPIIFLTGHGDVPMAVNALKKGAHDFLQKTARFSWIVADVGKAFERNPRATRSIGKANA